MWCEQCVSRPLITHEDTVVNGYLGLFVVKSAVITIFGGVEESETRDLLNKQITGNLGHLWLVCCDGRSSKVYCNYPVCCSKFCCPFGYLRLKPLVAGMFSGLDRRSYHWYGPHEAN